MTHLYSIAINFQIYLNNYRYILLKLHTGISTPLSLALSTCVLFISLMQSVNEEQFLNVAFLPLFPPPAAISVTALVPLTSIYQSL